MSNFQINATSAVLHYWKQIFYAFSDIVQDKQFQSIRHCKLSLVLITPVIAIAQKSNSSAMPQVIKQS